MHQVDNIMALFNLTYTDNKIIIWMVRLKMIRNESVD